MAATPFKGNKRYATWSAAKRYTAAVKVVLEGGDHVTGAARTYGVSRPRLSEKVNDARRAKADELERLKAPAKDPLLAIVQASTSPLGLQEKKRVGTFEEFDERYFGRWICPDCEVHHANPGFHRELMGVLQEHHPRLLINLPPYHAKSTLVTVKHTVYQIVQDPNHRTIIISKSLPFARTFLHSISELLTNPDLYPDGPNLVEDHGPFHDGDHIWNTNQIYVAGRVTAEKDPTVQVLGVGGSIYGRRADTIKCDDIADVNNQRNPEQVQKMLTWLDKNVVNRIGSRGRLIYVGTRVMPGDIYSYLKDRDGYIVKRFPLILDEEEGITLWPEHLGMDWAQQMRNDSSDADFQLVYQNIDVPGLGASFTPEMLDACKDPERPLGHFEPQWTLIAGLDPAGGEKGSGYTAGVLIGVDLRTGKRYLIDAFAQKSMRAPALKAQMFEWSAKYPITEWRVENNGLQSNLVQYNDDIIIPLAHRGISVKGHHTHGNKWDPQFGVESIAPLFTTNQISIPWANLPTRRVFQELCNQLVAFPMGTISDMAMAMWFAELGIRMKVDRSAVPMFASNRRGNRVPERIARRRKVVSFEQQAVMAVPEWKQTERQPGIGMRGRRRATVGRPQPWSDVDDGPEPIRQPMVNVPGYVEVDPGE